MILLELTEIFYLTLNLLYDENRISKHIPVRHPIDSIPIYIIYLTTILMYKFMFDIPIGDIIKNISELAGVRWLVHSTGLAWLRGLGIQYVDDEEDASLTDKFLIKYNLSPLLTRVLTLVIIIFITRIIL